MTTDSAGLFKPRKFGTSSSDASASKQSFLADSTSEFLNSGNLVNSSATGATELTKNDKYCVSRLPALPPILRNDRMSDSSAVLNGYTDNETKCALVVSETAINVWPYSSADNTPLSFEFPLAESAQHSLQMAILTRPTPGTTLDPGLAVVNSVTGHVCFYESVQYAPALGMINSRSIETTVSISAAQGEYITLAENVEPAGIAVATSWKRVVLVLLRDYKGAPQLSTLELTKPASSSLFSGWLGGSSQNDISDEIISIKSGSVSQHGTTQEIVVQDASGMFKKFLFQVSASGSAFINHRKTVSYKLSSYLEKNIDGLIPGSVLDTRFLDFWPSVQDNDASNDVYVALVSVSSSTQGSEESKLHLLKLKINESGVLVLSSHQLPSVRATSASLLDSRPRLYIPKPGKTAFVCVANSVIMTDLNPVSTGPSTPDFHFYEPRWEDVVHFKSSVQIIGYGFEDQSEATDNPALVFLTSEDGVVRIERFVDSPLGSTVENEDPSDPVKLLKSHINQAIFYGESSFVEFNVESGHSVNTVSPAVNSVVAELLDSSSPYLPPNFSSTRDSFGARIKLLRNLIDYVSANFADSLYVVLPVIVEALEKVEVASNLWNIIDTQDSEATEIRSMLKKVILDHDLVQKSASQDIIRAFFCHNVREILLAFTELVDVISSSNVSTKVLITILVSTLHNAVQKNEVEYIFGNSEIPPVKLWLFDSSLLVKAEQIYTQAYCLKNDTFQYLDSSASRNELIQLTETLYFLVSNAIHFMQQTHDDQLHEYLQWYTKRKGAWIEALVSRGLTKEALAISQKYHDFYSVANILEKEREQTSPEYVYDKIEFFMNQYGYDFASKLFDFYISQSHLNRILVDCKPYDTFLEQYFQEFPRKSNKVSWIYYLQSKDFHEASKVLMASSTDDLNEDQEQKDFHLSLAKLSAIAAKTECANADEASALDEIAVEAESNLVAVRIQNKIHQSISSYVEDKKELMTLDYFMDNFTNPRLRKNEIESDVKDFFQRFVDQKTLSLHQLILLLTSFNPTSKFSDVFADALKVSALISNDAAFHEQGSNIWKTLICATDDWVSVSSTEGNSDDIIKTRVRDTVLFKTLKKVQDNKEIMKVLDDVFEGDQDDSMVEGPWDEKLQQLMRECSLDLWIKTVRNEAR